MAENAKYYIKGGGVYLTELTHKVDKIMIKSLIACFIGTILFITTSFWGYGIAVYILISNTCGRRSWETVFNFPYEDFINQESDEDCLKRLEEYIEYNINTASKMAYRYDSGVFAIIISLIWSIL